MYKGKLTLRRIGITVLLLDLQSVLQLVKGMTVHYQPLLFQEWV